MTVGGVQETRLLVVEDDVKLSRALRRGLEHEGYAVDGAHTGEEALARAGERHYDAVVLDLMLPDRDGYGVCAELRARDAGVPS